MAHYVKCLYCGEQFDRDKVEYVQVSARRYAHPACVKNHNDNKTQEEKDLEQLEQYIMKLFDEPFVNARITYPSPRPEGHRRKSPLLQER